MRGYSAWWKGLSSLNRTIAMTEAGLSSTAQSMVSFGMAFQTALPWIAGIAAAISLVAVGIKNYKDAHPSLESLQKDAEAAKNEFNEMEQKVKDTSEKIEELNKLKEQNLLTTAESEELEYLERQNEIYTAQRDLLKEIADYKEQQAKDEANRAASQELQNFLSYTDRNLARANPDRAEGMSRRAIEANRDGYAGLLNALDDYAVAQEALDSLNKELIDSGLEAKKENQQISAEEAKSLQEMHDNIKSAEAELTKQKGVLASFKESLVGILGGLTDEEAIAQVESLLDMISDTGAFDDFTKNSENIGKSINKLSSDAKKALYAVTKGEKQLVDESGKLTKEGQEVVEWLKDTGLSAEDAAVYLARWANELSDTTITGPTVDTSTALADLTSLRDELEQTAKDIEAYNKAMEGGEKGDSAQTYKSAWEKAREDIKAGKNDTRAVHAAASLIFGEDQLAAWGYDNASIIKQFESNKALEAILGGKGDIGLNFGNYLKDNAKQYAGLVDVMKNGDGTFDLAIHDFEGLANAMGISEGFLYALVDGLDAFGSQRMMDDKDLADLHTQFDKMNGDVGQLIESLASQGLDGMEIISTLHQLDDAFSDINFGDEIYQQVADAMKKLRDGKDEEENDIPVGVTVEGGVDAMTAALKEMQAIADGHPIEVAFDDGGSDGGEPTPPEPGETNYHGYYRAEEWHKAHEDADGVAEAAAEAAESVEHITTDLDGDSYIFDEMMAAGAESAKDVVDAWKLAEANLDGMSGAAPVVEATVDADTSQAEEKISELGEQQVDVEVTTTQPPPFGYNSPSGSSGPWRMEKQSLWLPTDGGGGRTKNGSIDLDTNAEEIAARVQAAEDSVGDKSVNISTVADTSGASTAQAAVDSLPSSKTININFKVGKIPGLAQLASGTRNAPGGPTLVNELGPELISEKGRAYIAGGGLPTIVNLSKGAIVLDAEDTKKALSGKKAISGGIDAAAKGKGKKNTRDKYRMAPLVTIGGENYFVLTGNNERPVFVSEKSLQNNTTNATVPTSSDKKNKGGGGGGDGAKKNEDEDKKNKVDWIEVAIDRLTRAIDSLEKVFDSAFRTLDKRMSASNKEIAKIQEGFKTYQDGYERYLKEAESVGLDASIAALVKNGTIDIGKYDDDTKKKIDEFKQW